MLHFPLTSALDEHVKQVIHMLAGCGGTLEGAGKDLGVRNSHRFHKEIGLLPEQLTAGSVSVSPHPRSRAGLCSSTRDLGISVAARKLAGWNEETSNKDSGLLALNPNHN